MTKPITSVESRFHGRWIEDPVTGCWNWTKRLCAKGYGHIWEGGVGGKALYAHRVSWMLHREESMVGLLVCHKCDNRACVNPGHLFVGTHLDNNRDMMTKGRSRNRPTPGSTHYRAMLDESKVAHIRSSSESSKSLAVLFGVAPSTIRGVRCHHRWKHVP